MGDAGASDDPLGYKCQTREVEENIHRNLTPETSKFGLTILETKQKISDTFSNLEVSVLTLVLTTMNACQMF